MPGNEQEAAGLLDAHPERSDTGARLAQITEKEEHDERRGTGQDGEPRPCLRL